MILFFMRYLGIGLFILRKYELDQLRKLFKQNKSKIKQFLWTDYNLNYDLLIKLRLVCLEAFLKLRF